jgi:inhibitor of cysteine peptidase
MKTKLIALGLSLILALSLVACASATKETAVKVSIDEFQSQQNISQQVEVPAGGVLTVTLGSNRTTGFQWSETASISDSAVLKQTSHEYQAPDSTLAGAAGQEVWKFEALQKGTTTVSMEYSRPWEGGEKAEWTYTLTVTVK